MRYDGQAHQRFTSVYENNVSAVLDFGGDVGDRLRQVNVVYLFPIVNATLIIHKSAFANYSQKVLFTFYCNI